MPKIHWPQFQRTIEVPAGTTLLDAALDHEIPLEHACGGFCACTTCHVHIESGLSSCSSMEEDEKERIASVDLVTEQSRLGCQTKILDDVTVIIPHLS